MEARLKPMRATPQHDGTAAAQAVSKAKQCQSRRHTNECTCTTQCRALNLVAKKLLHFATGHFGNGNARHLHELLTLLVLSVSFSTIIWCGWCTWACLI